MHEIRTQHPNTYYQTLRNNEEMGSKRTKFPIPTARLQALILSNKKLSFVISIIIVTLIYYGSLHLSQQSSNNKRRGVGGRDAQGELSSTLRRQDNGRAAVAIIRVIGISSGNNLKSNPHNDVQYLVQMKSHDYPIKNFRGSVCLLGGNANQQDLTPLDTLKRELNEELQYPEWVNAINPNEIIDDSAVKLSKKPLYNSTVVPLIPGSVRYLGTTLHSHTAKLIQKFRPYSFLCALYEITLRPDQLPPSVLYPRGANVQEGRLALLSEDQLMKHAKYAWGYEFTMGRYFGRNATNICEGASVTDVEENIWTMTPWTPWKR